MNQRRSFFSGAFLEHRGDTLNQSHPRAVILAVEVRYIPDLGKRRKSYAFLPFCCRFYINPNSGHARQDFDQSIKDALFLKVIAEQHPG